MWTPIADRDPRLAVAVPGLHEKLARGLHSAGSVILAGEAWDEEGDRLVADELVHDPVPAVDDPRGGAPEAGQELPELAGRQLLGEPGRPADVGEQRGDLDLGAAGMLVRRLDAPRAEPAVQRRRLAAEHADEEVARLSERRVTELAAGLRRDLLPERLGRPEPTHLAHQDLPPFLARDRVAHRGSRILRPFDRWTCRPFTPRGWNSCR